jgi:hypothetical protein
MDTAESSWVRTTSRFYLTEVRAGQIVRRDSWGSAARHRSQEASENRPFQKNGWGGI